MVQTLNATVVTSTTSECIVLLEEGLNLSSLMLGHPQRMLHDEPLDTLVARGSGERAVIGVILATEGFTEKAKINEAVNAVGTISGNMIPINVFQERVGETTLWLNVEEDAHKQQIIEIAAALLLVHNVELHRVGLVVDGVLRRSVEVELLNIVLLTVARIATTNGNKAQIASNLKRVAVVDHAQVLSEPVMIVNAESASTIFTMANANSGVVVLSLDIDGRLALSCGTRSAPVSTVLIVLERRGLHDVLASSNDSDGDSD